MVNWRRVTILLLILLALMTMIMGYMYTINDQSVYHVTYKSIDTDPTEHLQIYEVMVFPGVDEGQVERSLLLCPNMFGYVIVPCDDTRFFYTPEDWGWSQCPFPNEGETSVILIVDHDDYPSVTYGAWTTEEGRAIVFVRDNWPDMVLSDVITHECCHTVEGPKNIMDNQPLYTGQFSLWLTSQWYGDVNGINKNGMTRLYNDWAIDTILSQSQFLEDAEISTQTISSSV